MSKATDTVKSLANRYWFPVEETLLKYAPNWALHALAGTLVAAGTFAVLCPFIGALHASGVAAGAATAVGVFKDMFLDVICQKDPSLKMVLITGAAGMVTSAILGAVFH